LTLWKNDQLPTVSKFQISSEDLTLISYVRRKTLLTLVPLYTLDFMQGLIVVNELEDFFKEFDTRASRTYTDILKEEIVQREHQLLEAQEIAEVGSFSWNLTTMEGNSTPQLLKILELEKGAPLRLFFSKVHPDDRDKIHDAMREAKENNSVFDCEYRYFTSAREKVIWSRGNVMMENDQPVLKGTVMDITRRQEILKQLKESDQLYKQAQERAHIGNFVWDLRSNKIRWSDELYRIYDLDPHGEPIQFEKFADMLDYEGREIILDQIQKAIASRQPADFNFRITLPSKKTKILNIKADVILDENNNAAKIVGTTQDITEKQELMDQLQKSEAQLKQAQAISHIGSWEEDIATRKLSWSDEVFRIYGLEPRKDGITQDEVIKFRHPDDDQFIKEQFAHAIATHEPLDISFRIILPDNKVRHLHVKAEVLTDNKNKAVKLFGTVQDITKIVEAEMVLQQKNKQLQQSNANLEEFAYVASHDMKEPLRKISTFGEMLLSFTKDNLTTQAKMYVDKMIEGGKRMQKMIDDLLELSTIAHNKAFAKVSLQEAVDKALLDLELKVKENRATITSDGLPEAVVVQSQFEQLFLNLIGNSLKFRRPDVAPVINITHKQLTTAEVTKNGLLPGVQYLRITLRDNGIGFEPEYADKIFGMFQRLHGKVDFEGSGIGLAIVKKIAEHHGGIIQAEGKLNEGAAFTVIIPIK
jgi:PAS domain S-box-containing protein